MSAETPSLSDVIEMWLAQYGAQHHHAVPGKVQSFDVATNTVTVEPTTKVVSRNADGERLVDTLPVLPGIPVAWPRGGTYFISMPLAAGDGGLIVFTDTDLGAWRDSGQVSDPGDERRHALGGAVFYPGLETVARTLADGGHMVVGKTGGPAIHIDGSTVQLGAAGGSPVALASSTGLVAWISQVTSAVNGLAPGAITALTPFGTPPGAPADVAATLTKAT